MSRLATAAAASGGLRSTHAVLRLQIGSRSAARNGAAARIDLVRQPASGRPALLDANPKSGPLARGKRPRASLRLQPVTLKLVEASVEARPFLSYVTSLAVHVAAPPPQSWVGPSVNIWPPA